MFLHLKMFFDSAITPRLWLWVALFALGLAGAFPGSTGIIRPLDSHEIFVAQTAEEMIRNVNFLVPTFNGELRLQKPPLSYWAVAGIEYVGDEEFPHISEFEARLPSALSAIALLFVVAGMGFVAFNDGRIGLVSGALLATTWGFHNYSHSARPEMLYTFFCSLEMLGFLWLQRSEAHSHTNFLAGLVAWGGFTGAVMTKGPLLPLFIMLGVIVALGMRHPRPSFLPSFRPFMGFLFALVTGLYFVYLASMEEGAGTFWVDQMLQSTEVPLWLRPLRMYFIFAAVKLLLPWSLILLITIKEIWRTRNPAALILSISSLTCLVLLSFSGKVRLHYILPAIPFLCVLMAWAGVGFYDRHLGEKTGRMQLARLLSLHVWMLGAAAVGLSLLVFQNVPYKNVNPWTFVLPLMIVSLAIGCLSWYYRKRQMIRAFGCLIIMASLISAGMGFGALGYRTKWYVETDFARKVGEIAPRNLPLFTNYDFLPYLLYYGGRKSQPIYPQELSTFQAVHHSPALLVYDRDKLRSAGLKGRELYQGHLIKGGKPVILFQTKGEDISARAGL